MKVSTERLENCRMTVILEMDPADLDKALRQKARELARQYTFPGYRKGKATYRAVVRAIGREALQTYWFEDAAEGLVTEALEGLDAEPYAPPELEDVEWDPFRITLMVPLQPVVDLGDYRSLRMEPEPVAVSDEQIQEQLREYQEQQAQWVPADRPAAEGDQVVVDVQASLDDETIWEEENLELLLGANDASSVPGLYEHLVGMAAGETKSFSLALPEDWDDEEYAGVEAALEATLREIREKDVPPLDDDLAMTVGDYDSLDDLRTSIREALEEETQQRIEAEFPGLVVDALVERGEHLEYPDRAVEDQLDDMLESLQANLQGTGLGLEQYFQLMRMTEAQYRQQLRPEAEKRLRRSLALVELAREEGLDVPPDEVEAETGRVEESLPEEAAAERQWLHSPEGQMGIANRLLTERVQERLLAIARGEAPALPLEEPEADAVVDADAEPEPEAEPSTEPSEEQAADTEPSDEPRAEPVAAPEPEETAADASGTEPEPAAEADG